MRMRISLFVLLSMTIGLTLAVFVVNLTAPEFEDLESLSFLIILLAIGLLMIGWIQSWFTPGQEVEESERKFRRGILRDGTLILLVGTGLSITVIAIPFLKALY